jgi:hypothetical protein
VIIVLGADTTETSACAGTIPHQDAAMMALGQLMFITGVEWGVHRPKPATRRTKATT